MRIDRPDNEDNPEARAAHIDQLRQEYTEISTQPDATRGAGLARVRDIWQQIPEAERPVIRGQLGGLTDTEKTFKDAYPDSRPLRGCSPQQTADIFCDTIKDTIYQHGTTEGLYLRDAEEEVQSTLSNMRCADPNEQKFAESFSDRAADELVSARTDDNWNKIVQPEQVYESFTFALSALRRSPHAANAILDRTDIDSHIAREIATDLQAKITTAPSKGRFPSYANEEFRLAKRLMEGT